MCLTKMANHCFNIKPIDIKLLVSVKCSILLVDFLKQEVKTFFDGATATRSQSSLDYSEMCESYYGITWDKQKEIIYVVGSEPDVEDGHYLKTKICRLTPNGNFIDYIPVADNMKFSGAHQIHYYGGFIFVADTLNNCVRKIDPNTGDGQTLKVDIERFGEDFNHINSVWVDDHYIYVMGRSLDGVISMLYIFDRDSCIKLSSIKQGMSGCHNITKLWNQRVTLSGYRSALVGEKDEVLIKVKHFTRGLSIIDDYIFIGQSVIAKRLERLNSNAGWISIHNSKNGSYIGNITLHNVGQIHEIRCLNQKDYAHQSNIL